MTKSPTSILRKINDLQNLDREALLSQYASLNIPNACALQEPALRRMIAYRLQEKHFEGLSSATKQKVENEGAKEPIAVQTSKTEDRSFCPGTKLVRVWKGITHEVIIRNDGMFEHDGRLYKSLSAVASNITGTRWNGKVFFGIKK